MSTHRMHFASCYVFLFRVHNIVSLFRYLYSKCVSKTTNFYSLSYFRKKNGLYIHLLQLFLFIILLIFNIII